MRRYLGQVSANRSSLDALPAEDETTHRRLLSTEHHAIDWLADNCPNDLVAYILAYAGPQTVSSLSRVNKTWNCIVSQEKIWRVLCEQYGKWNASTAPIDCWKDYYAQNPLVPVDYTCLETAVETLQYEKKHSRDSLRVLVRPGSFQLQQSIHILDAWTNDRTVTIERVGSSENVNHKVVISSPTTEYNTPLLRISQGHVILKGLTLHHSSKGSNVQAGNSAVYVQSIGHITPSRLQMEGCHVTSDTGRGVVVKKDAILDMTHCHVFKCASTGIALDCDARASIRQSDVVQSGDAGILVQNPAHLTLENSNVSFNAGNGVELVGQDDASLLMSRNRYPSSIQISQCRLNENDKSVASQTYRHGHVVMTLGPAFVTWTAIASFVVLSLAFDFGSLSSC